MNYLQIDNLTKSYGDLVLFENLSLSVDKDQRVALIARNGTGKTSLLRIIGGKDTADSGSVIFRNGLSVAYLDQSPSLNSGNTVLQEVYQTANEVLDAVNEYEAAIAQHDAERINRAMQTMDHLKAWDYEVKVKQILGQLKITDFAQKVGELSGGQKKRVALAAVLVREPDVLILDEPTNHLDLDMIEWLENYLKASKSTLIMVTHDRYFLDNVCDVIYELDNKQLYRYRGNYSYFLEKRDERIYNQTSEIDKARQLYKKELDWMNRMPSARGTKAKSRIDAFYDIKETAHQKIASDKVQIDVKSSRIGKKIIDIYNIFKRFDDKIIVEDFTYNFKRGDKVGLIGPNGAGKTTFLNMITGNEPVNQGRIETGSTIVFGYYTQEGEQFDDSKRVIEVVQDIAEEISVGEGRKLSPTQFLNYFLFTGDMQYSYVNKLSGGERRRLYLLTVLMRNPNFLILDEPTNDLDIMTLNVLEDYLKQFDGCVLIVSHDRFFMDKIVDHMFVMDDGGKVQDFPGNYSQYRDWKTAKEAAKSTSVEASAKPKREKNRDAEKKKLTFAEQREYTQLEAEIEQLELEKGEIEARLSSGTVTNDEIVKASKRLSEIGNRLEVATDRWLELSEFV